MRPWTSPTDSSRSFASSSATRALAASPRASSAGLSVAEAELPLLRLGDRHPGLEVLEGDAEPSREDAERLQRRVALTRFDPRNVRIRHAWSGQFSLRQSPLETEAANSRSDRLLAG